MAFSVFGESSSESTCRNDFKVTEEEEVCAVEVSMIVQNGELNVKSTNRSTLNLEIGCTVDSNLCKIDSSSVLRVSLQYLTGFLIGIM